MRLKNLKTLFHNLSYLSRFDIRKMLREDLPKVSFQSSLANLMLYSQDIEDGDEKSAALAYVKETHRFDMIPYRRIRNEYSFESGIDEGTGLPYVVHNGVNLYFPYRCKVEDASSSYKHFIEDEQLTGERFREFAPHCYVSCDFRIEKEDVLVDVGCAEGLFSLSFIEGLSHAYLVENDPSWFAPIELTFKDYLNSKVTLIKKTVGSINSVDSITLESIIDQDPHQSFFVKMDIEGAEVGVLKASFDFLKHTKKRIKLAVCCYHRREDAKEIEHLFKAMGYSFHYSDGFILASFFDPSDIYSFRRGIIRAKNF